jgi:hypothetical protein
MMTDKEETDVAARMAADAVADGIIAKLKNLERGAKLVYHTGQLAYDREGTDPYCIRLNKIANTAYKLAQEWRLSLVQEKIYVDPANKGRDVYLYIAQGC